MTGPGPRWVAWFLLLSAATASGSSQEPARVDIRLAAADGSFRLVGMEERVGTGAETRLEVSPGDWVLHFGPAQGRKPASLPLTLPPGARVAVAAGREEDLEEADPVLFEDFGTGLLVGWDAMGSDKRHWQVADGLLRHAAESTDIADDHVLLAGEPAWQDYLFEAQVRAIGGGPAGLLLRYVGEGDHYALTLDVAGNRVLFERVVGGERLLLQETEVLLEPGIDYRVACQGDGFRLQVWIDDVSTVRVLDGAHDKGRVGVFASPVASVAFDEIRVRPPVQPAPVVATVASKTTAEGECTVHGAAPGAVGLDAWVHFAMEHAWPPGLRDGHGLGPFLVTEGRRPWFLGQGRTVAGAVSQLRDEGLFSAAFRWPRTPALHGQVVLVEVWLASPDGAEVRETLPRVRVVL